MSRPGYAPAVAEVDWPMPLPTRWDLAVFVPGHPVAKGDLEVVNLAAVRKGAFPVLRAKNATALQSWGRLIRGALAAHGWVGPCDYAGAVVIWCGFVLERPKTLDRIEVEPYHTARRNGDVDKLLRGVLDEITGKEHGVIGQDDAQMIAAPPEKRYARRGEPTGLHLRVRQLERAP